MNPQDYRYHDFHDAQVGARRQLHPARVSDRFSEPTVILTSLLLLFAVVYNLWGSPTLETVICQLENTIWDSVVTLTPCRLVQAIEKRRLRNSGSSMEVPLLDTHTAKSEAMRRILGLGSTSGVMISAFQNRKRALSMSSMLGFKADPERPPGLGNRDNSCFQNSILQGLASLQTFPDYLSACVRAADLDDGNGEVAQTLRTLISDLTDGAHDGRTIWTPSKLRFMSTWTQQDAQEYYSKILDDIDKGIATAVAKNQRQPGFESDGAREEGHGSEHSEDSGYQSASISSRSQDLAAARNPLEGLLAQRVACVQCGYSEGLSLIPFNCLTLSLGLDRRHHDLYERLDAYSKVEPIEGVECSKCTLLKAQRLLAKLIEQMRRTGSTDEQIVEPLRRLKAVEEALEEDDFDDKTVTEKCKISAQSRVSSTKTKQVVIARPPRSLAIHMNRSVFDPSTFNMMKNSAPVSFPLTLDLGPWCLGSKTMTSSEGNSEKHSPELWALDPRASMIAGDSDTSRLSGPIYELRAAVTHSGRHENGHYICYRRHGRRKPLVSESEPFSSAKNHPSSDQDEVQSADGSETVQEPSEKASSSKPGPEENDMIWWRLSDHNVSRVEEDTILSLSSGVFMLFYDCVDPSMIVNEDSDIMQDAETTLNEEAASGGEANGDTLPIATPELTGDDDGTQTEIDGPVTPHDGAERTKESNSQPGAGELRALAA